MKKTQQISLFVSSAAGIGWLPASTVLLTLPIAILIVKYVDVIAPYFAKESMSISLPFYFFTAIIAGIFINNVSDNQRKRVVIDRIWGFVASLFLIPLSWKTVTVAFMMYHFVDIVKPWPLYHVTNIDGGVGAILDDIIAGLVTAGSIHLIIIVYLKIMAYL